MADQLIERVLSMKITAEEEGIIELGGITEESTDTSMSMAVVGKVVTVRSYNFDALKRTMNQIWTLTKEALFRQIENGLFVIQFAAGKDKKKVMEGRPWTFDNNLILLEEIDGSSQPSNIPMQWCPFWLRLYNLPMNSRSEQAVRAIGGCIGEVLEVESDGIVWDTSARLKVRLDVSKPLRRVQKIKAKGGEVSMIEIKYERLPTFCYECGVIGHIERDCQVDRDEGDEDTKQWGTWLRASPRRGRIKLMEETKAFLRSNRKLNFDGPLHSGWMKGDGRRVEDTRGRETITREDGVRGCASVEVEGERITTGNNEWVVQSNPGAQSIAVKNAEEGIQSGESGLQVGSMYGKAMGECGDSEYKEPQVGEGEAGRKVKESYGKANGEVASVGGGLESLRTIAGEESGRSVVITNLDTQMEELSETVKKEGKKWKRVAREQAGVKGNGSIEKHDGKAKQRERDKLADEEEMVKKRIVAAAEVVVAGPTPWALGEQ